LLYVVACPTTTTSKREGKTALLSEEFPQASCEIMKLLTHNFLSCAAKTCKSSPDSFPLKFEEVELTSVEMDYNPQFLVNVLSRVDWPALVKTAVDVIYSTHRDTKLDSWAKRVCRRRSLKTYRLKTMSKSSACFIQFYLKCAPSSPKV
jgi:hypothetical protein